MRFITTAIKSDGEPFAYSGDFHSYSRDPEGGLWVVFTYHANKYYVHYKDLAPETRAQLPPPEAYGERQQV